MFQSTPARGGRLDATLREPTGVDCFNPRPHAAGDAACDQPSRPTERVSIHARTRRATATISMIAMLASMFQSTPARGGRRRGTVDASSAGTFQSTPARGGRPRRTGRRADIDRVSIHARTRRATATPIGNPRIAHDCFNPRPHAAGDQSLGRLPRATLHVSIHARTRRATIRLPAGLRRLIVFQSTPARGGRPARPTARRASG